MKLSKHASRSQLSAISSSISISFLSQIFQILLDFDIETVMYDAGPSTRQFIFNLFLGRYLTRRYLVVIGP
jgi:hypothetical protein